MNEATIPTNTPSLGKIRSVGAVVALNLLTLGIYSIYWWWAINRELRDFGTSRKTSALSVRPLLSAVAFFFGGCIVVPFVWTSITTNQRIESARRIVENVAGPPPWVAPVLLCVAILAFNVGGVMTEVASIAALLLAGWALELAAIIRMQLTLNAVWRHEGAVPGRGRGTVDPAPPIGAPTTS